MLLLLDVLADVPVLLGNLTLSWGYAGLAGLHVAVDLDGVLSAALIRVNPVLTCKTQTTSKLYSTRPTSDCPRTSSPVTVLNCSPLFQSGWHILRSLQVLAGFLRVPSGLRICSICWLRLFRVLSTSRSRSRRTLASSARYMRKGSGAFS